MLNLPVLRKVCSIVIQLQQLNRRFKWQILLAFSYILYNKSSVILVTDTVHHLNLRFFQCYAIKIKCTIWQNLSLNHRNVNNILQCQFGIINFHPNLTQFWNFENKRNCYFWVSTCFYQVHLTNTESETAENIRIHFDQTRHEILRLTRCTNITWHGRSLMYSFLQIDAPMRALRLTLASWIPENKNFIFHFV